jgi:hypothetical protein
MEDEGMVDYANPGKIHRLMKAAPQSQYRAWPNGVMQTGSQYLVSEATLPNDVQPMTIRKTICGIEFITCPEEN